MLRQAVPVRALRSTEYDFCCGEEMSEEAQDLATAFQHWHSRVHEWPPTCSGHWPVALRPHWHPVTYFRLGSNPYCSWPLVALGGPCNFAGPFVALARACPLSLPLVPARLPLYGCATATARLPQMTDHPEFSLYESVDSSKTNPRLSLTALTKVPITYG